MTEIQIIDFAGHPLQGTDLLDATAEMFRITSLGADGTAQGERWDYDQHRYRKTKPIVLRSGIQKITIEYAEDE